ncbi:MAG: type I DNA topoisomerase [bacterium]|nr:type I DNA topoisomerase [bacterium]
MADAKQKNLVIVESPAKAKTIGRFLGPEYRVESSYGHVRDLPQSAKEIPTKLRSESWARLGVNVDSGFEPLYVVPVDKKKHVKRLKDALKDADRLLLATDEDREGESISWHVLQLLKPKKSVAVERIVFHEVTPEAITSALSKPRPVDENLVRAQEARRVLDRLYGYSLSPLLWKRIRPGLSAGRVQSVAVRLLVEKERQRIAFVSARYWDLKAELQTEEGSFKARLTRLAGQRIVDSKSFDANTGKLVRDRRHLEEKAALALAENAGESRPWRVSSLDRVPGKQNPAPPFITSTLQQEGNRKLRFSSRHTMRIAQQLYEGIDLGGERIGLITYMRTDSVTLAGRAIAQAREVIANRYGTDYLPEQPRQYKTKAKRAQEAHEAIRPTDLARRPQDVKSFLDDEQFRLYELIWKRTIACQMVPARFERTAVEVEVEAGETLTFAASGRRILFPGFLRAYVEGSDDPKAQLGDQETLLPALEEGQQVEPASVDAEGHSTKPPYRFTEASLVKKLEEEGIGRPSTYASIISTILDRGYASKKGNELIPSFTAFCVTSLLEKQFGDLVDTRFTALMEDELDDVAAGKLPWDTPVSDFYLGGDSNPGLSRRLAEGEVTYPSIPLGKDPETGDEVIIKVGRYGPYVRRGEGGKENVATIPDGTAPDELDLEVALALLRAKNSEDEPLTADPVTGRPVTLKSGRFGEYLELGQTEDEREAKKKPRRVSLPRGLSSADLTEEIAQKLIQLPRSLGTHPDNSDPISTGLGRYGPFLKRGDEFRNLESWERACDIQLDEALEILKQPKPERKRFGAKKTVLKELGEIEGAAGPVNVLDGRYGPYVTDGKTNVTVPKGSDPLAVTPEQAKEMLDAKRKAPKKKRRRRRS